MKIHLQPMNVKGRYCFSFDDFECYTYANVTLERSLHANEGHIGVKYIDHNETNEWIFSANEQQKGVLFSQDSL